MKSADPKGYVEAAVFAYALMRAVVDEMDEATRKRVVERALNYLPPRPGADDPVNQAIWRDVQSSLRTLVGP